MKLLSKIFKFSDDSKRFRKIDSVDDSQILQQEETRPFFCGLVMFFIIDKCMPENLIMVMNMLLGMEVLIITEEEKDFWAEIFLHPANAPITLSI